ncbi:MAG: energy transducer TonB, partial [Pseudomonadota bacterium]
IETMDISVISGEAFDQLRQGSVPEPDTAEPEAPVAPPVVDAPPEQPATADTPAEPAPPPPPVQQPDVDTPPPVTPSPPPSPTPAEVADAPPTIAPPPPVPELIPDVPESDEPTPPQAPTVASTINAPPPPDAAPDDIQRDAILPDDSATADVVEQEQQATAPEETTTQIVIEDLAPSTSVRPSARPNRPAPPVDTASAETGTTETDQAEPADTTDDVLAALESAQSETPAPALPAGPPMTGAERDSFRIAVNRCWNVDPGSVAARVIVEVGFSLNRDGTVIGNSVELLSSDGDPSATDTAFQAARRAILRCQSGGYQLPADKYDQWREVVITFDPSGMRLR